jgi:4-hydroxy-3-methylbut-2-enyl diphosphate reductase
LIEDHRAIDPTWLTDVKRIGITSGASAPERLVDEAIGFFKEAGAEIKRLGFIEENIHFALPAEIAHQN